LSSPAGSDIGPPFSIASEHKSDFFWSARSTASVSFFNGERLEVEQLSRRIFGRALRTWEYAGMAGAPDEASVTLGECDGQIYVETDFPGELSLRASHCVRRELSRVVIVMETLCIGRPAMRQKGLGLKIFARQLLNADLLGIGHISTTAGRQLGENGYYTWPRFGFDGPLSDDVRGKLPKEMKGSRSVADLMCRESDRRWWRKHGTTIAVCFDLSLGSRSRRMFARYVQDKIDDGWYKNAH
jgi:hypothetical protein